MNDAYAYCERLAREHYENFPVASRLLPRRMRPHIAAIYAFARIADDIADEGDDPPAQRLRRLEAWRRRLHTTDTSTTGAHGYTRTTEGNAPHAEVFVALRHTIAECRLPVSLFDDLISAFAQDVTVKQYATWADVLDYCRRSANPIGRLVLRVAGRDDAGLDAASDALCTALQLTNFWQDFAIDWAGDVSTSPRTCGSRRARACPTSRHAVSHRNGVRRLPRRRAGPARCSPADAASATALTGASGGSCARRGSAACACSTGSRHRDTTCSARVRC